MTWHLKDRELEKQLIKIAPNFVESLNESLKLVEHEENSCTYKIGFGPYKDCYKFEMHVFDEELEEVPEYNPKIWNDSRKVIPPEDVVFRAKIHRVFCRETPYVDYECLTYKDGRWYKVRDGKVRPVRIDFNPGDYVEFKAWED